MKRAELRKIIKEEFDRLVTEGRSVTPRYTLTIKDQKGKHTSVWAVKAQYGMKGYGTPNEKNIRASVQAFVDSVKDGQPNAHLQSYYGGELPKVKQAWIKDQFNERKTVINVSFNSAEQNSGKYTK